MDKRYIIGAAILVVIGFVAVFALYNPWTPLGATLSSAGVSHIGLHLAEGAQTYFIVVVSVENPSRVPVALTFGEIKFHVNGSEYPTVDLGSDPVTLGLGEARGIERLVLVTGSPIGFQAEGTERYLLETSWSLKGTARGLGLEASRDMTLEDTTSWWYQIGF
jgi:hypothetical protein